MSIINYFFENHLERCKKELENFENNKFKEVKEDLRVETRKCIEEINNFLRNINAKSFADFKDFNKKIKTFNEELNRIMKASANISTLVYVIQNVSEDDFYTYTDFISYFAYDENKFNNASERDIKYLKLLDKYLQKTNDDFEVYKERGDLRADLGLYDAAIDDYKKAIELNPNYNEAKQALGEINKKLLSNKESEKYYEEGLNYFKERKWKESVQSFDKAIELDNTKSKYYSARCKVKNGLKQYKEAKKDAEIALELDKNNAETYFVLGNIKRSLSKLEEAIDDYKKAIELNPNYNEAEQALKRTENYLDIHNFINNNSLIENDSGKDSGYYFNKAYKFYNERKYKESIVYYNKAIELYPNYTYAYYNRGLAKFNLLGDYEEAIKDYDKAILLDPNYINAYNQIGFYKTKLANIELKNNNISKAKELLNEAIEYCDKGIGIVNDYSSIYDTRGYAKTKLANIERYNRNIEKAVEIYNECLKDFDKAMELNPEHSYASNSIGYIKNILANIQKGNITEDEQKRLKDEALVYFEKAYKIANDKLKPKMEKYLIKLAKENDSVGIEFCTKNGIDYSK